MNRLLLRVAFLICSTVSTALVSAQTSLPLYQFGIQAGFLVYQGDLTPNRIGAFETQKFGIGIHASRILNPILSVRAHLQLGKLKGDDAVYDQPEFRQQRNFLFTSPVTEFSGQLVWNLTGSNYAEKGFSGYLFAGAGISFIKVKRDWSRLNVAYFGTGAAKLQEGLSADSAHRPPRVIPVLPVGAGFNYFFTPNWGINAEANYRIGRTDYLDGFSRAANPDNADKYFGYSIGVVFRTGQKSSLKCPVVKY